MMPVWRQEPIMIMPFFSPLTTHRKVLKLTTFQQKRSHRGIMFLCLTFVLWGCASERAAQKEPFFEKWSTMAQESKGHSPVPRARIVILPGAKQAEGPVTAEGAPSIEEIKPVKTLSDAKVTMKMRQADIKAVIRSLARVSGKNILTKNDIKGEINVDFTDVPWDQAFNSILSTQGLSYILDGEIIRVLSLEDMEQSLKMSTIQEKRRAQTMEVKRVEPLVTMVVNVDYADPEALRDNLQDFLSKDKEGKIPLGSIKVDKNSNSLIIQAIRDDITRMIPVVEKLDTPAHQIHIKANIVETTKDTARNLGIQWGGIYGRQLGDQALYVTPGGTGGSTISPTGPLAGNYNPLFGSPGISGQGFGVNFPATGMGATASASLGLLFGTIGGNILEVQLNALQKDSKLNILSSPSITTLDNQKAFTENGERVPIVSSSGLTGTQVRFEDAVLRLEITPHVIDGKNLKMKILVKKDEVDLSRQVQGNPFIIKKQTETTLIVQDGETIVISGLSKQRDSGATAGVPGLMNIPVLGWLFKGQDDADQMQEVLIFITPTILPPPGQAAAAEAPDKPFPEGR